MPLTDSSPRLVLRQFQNESIFMFNESSSIFGGNMPRTATRTRRQKVEEKERAILAATRAVFRDQGPERAKITEIAKAANLAEGTVYLYFKNKKALLLAAVSDFYAELTHDAEEVVKP